MCVFVLPVGTELSSYLTVFTSLVCRPLYLCIFVVMVIGR